MVRSMTGYGRAEQTLDGRIIAVELKSVNHRYFEFSTRLPRGCGYMEEKLKGLAQSRVSRGKVDLYLTVFATGGEDETVRVNTALAASYLAALRELGAATGLSDDVSLSLLSRMPDVLALEKRAVDEDALWRDVKRTAEEAIARFVAMREAEGGRLRDDLLGRLDAVEGLLAVVEEQSPRTVADYRARILQKVTELLADRAVDEGRVLTEVAVFSERIAVAEETVRLRSHISQFRGILAREDAMGRKLDFLTQEMNREANTIGSKAQDAAVAAVVVELKSELEKIREQIQNIE